MIAFAYLAVMLFFGDALGRRWFSYVSLSQRVATAFLIGLLAGSFASYLTALALSGVGLALGWADLLVASALLVIGAWLWRRPRSATIDAAVDIRSERWDWLVIGLFVVLAGWMMFSTYGYGDDKLRIAVGLWSDFGPTTAIAQSFAVGSNFPTEYPHFAGEPIRYHFLYYFQVGNLTQLGLDPALANNVLSVGSVVAMLALVIALGRRLFRSALVGRIGAGLFFVHGSLSFLPLIASYGSVEMALAELPKLTAFVDSGFPYRGEEWGIWSQMVFLNQRHFASGIGLLLVVVLFLLQRLPQPPDVQPTAEGVPVAGVRPETDPLTGSGVEPDSGVSSDLDASPVGDTLPAMPPTRAADRLGFASLPRTLPAPTLNGLSAAASRLVGDRMLPGYAFCGLVAGLLPLWNGAMFIAAAVVLAVWLLIFPNRAQTTVLGISAAIASIPQLLFLRAGAAAGEQNYPAFYWGYVIENPTVENVAAYVGFIFGPKLLLIAIALIVATSLQRRVFLAMSSLIAVAFLVQIGVEVLANHKFINVWLVVANLFAAAGLVTLWRARPAFRVPASLVAIALAIVIVAGGVIELIPIKNQGSLEYGMDGDPLYEWLRDETDEQATFLSHLYVAHPITLAGRRLFLGWTYYAWSAGYDVRERESHYRDLFAVRSPRELAIALQAHGITHVAFDDGLRRDGFAPQLNEHLYQDHFEQVFVDTDNRYANLAIYAVPSDPAAADALPGAPAEDMYTGGNGTEPGPLDGPQGMAFDGDGTLLVADSGSGRIQRFSSNGSLVATLGVPGTGPGQLGRPTGVAVDPRGYVYVADAGNGRVQVLDPTGAVAAEHSADAWTTDPDAAEPVDVVATDWGVLVLDAGLGQIVLITPEGTVQPWPTAGGEGQLRRPTGITFTSDVVVVADTGNARVAVFSRDGAFLRSFPVPEWAGVDDLTPDVVGDTQGRLWLSSPQTNSILVYQLGGSPLGSVEGTDGVELAGPAGLAFHGGSLFVANNTGNRVTLLVRPNP